MTAERAFTHGTGYAYRRRKCRCEAQLSTAPTTPTKKHGCRCEACRACKRAENQRVEARRREKLGLPPRETGPPRPLRARQQSGLEVGQPVAARAVQLQRRQPLPDTPERRAAWAAMVARACLERRMRMEVAVRLRSAA